MTTHSTPRFRLWVELAALTMTVFFALLTFADPTWIEQISGVDPDRGNGSLEAGIVAGFVLLSMLSAVLSWREWRRPARVAGKAA